MDAHHFSLAVQQGTEALPEYVQGGEIYDIMKDIDAPADGTISGVFPVPDATAFGAVETASKDVAAFTVEDTSAILAELVHNLLQILGSLAV